MTQSEILSTNSEALLNPVRVENLAVAQAAAREWLQDLNKDELLVLVTNPEKFTQRVLQEARVSLSGAETELLYEITNPLFNLPHTPESEKVINQFVAAMRMREGASIPLRHAVSILLAALITTFSIFGEQKSVRAADVSETPPATSTATRVPTETPIPVGTNAPEQSILPTPTPTPFGTPAPSTPETGVVPVEIDEREQLTVEVVKHTYRQVIVEIANVRQSPSTTAEIVSRAPRGTEIEILKSSTDSAGRSWVYGTFFIIEAGQAKQIEGYIADELLGAERTDESVTYTGESIGGSLTREQLLAKDPFRAEVAILDASLVVVDHLGQPIEKYDSAGTTVIAEYELLTLEDLQKKITDKEIDQQFQDAITYFPEKILVVNQAGEPEWVDGSNIRPVFRIIDKTLQAVVELGDDLDPTFMEWFPVEQEPARRGWAPLQFATPEVQYFIDAEFSLPNDTIKLKDNEQNRVKLAGVRIADTNNINNDRYGDYYLGINTDFDLASWLRDNNHVDTKREIIEVSDFSSAESLSDLMETISKLTEDAIQNDPSLEKIQTIKVRLRKSPQSPVRKEYTPYQTGGISYLPKNPYSINDGVLSLDITNYDPDSMRLSWYFLEALSYVLEDYYAVSSEERIEAYPQLPRNLELSKFAFRIVKIDGKEVIVPLFIPIAVQE